jgi:hypothetical protein
MNGITIASMIDSLLSLAHLYHGLDPDRSGPEREQRAVEEELSVGGHVWRQSLLACTPHRTEHTTYQVSYGTAM